MTKKNIIVLLIMAVLLVGSLLFADTVTFTEGNGNRTSALFGTIRVLNETTQHWEIAKNQTFMVTIYRDNVSPLNFTTNTDDNGFYEVDAELNNIPLEHITKFVVHFKGNQYTVNYDVSVQPFVRLNIDWYKLF